jgi:hypothetical protein
MMINFRPTGDVAAIAHHLLDIYERRGGEPKQVVRVKLYDLAQSLPGYYSQVDPTPRVTANEQLDVLARQGVVRLAWQPGQTSHLLESISLEVSQAAVLYALVGRQPLAEQRQQLQNLLLAHRSHLTGWRRQALEACLDQLRAQKSPAPFSLTGEPWNQDLLTILMALPDETVAEEIPYRVFSVRLFNQSKRFELFKEAVARLARQHQPAWRDLTPQEALRELGLVANPGHIYMYGPWRLVDADGQAISLAGFYPSVGLPAALAARVRQVQVDAPRVVCVENLASFYELIRYEGRGLAALCLWGNPSPATRHLLGCLAESQTEEISLRLWADIDYGGLNILAQLRQQVSPHFTPYRMDCATLAGHARWAQPLTPADQRNLTRLRQHQTLADMVPVIDEMLLREIKLEQEAVVLAE